MSVLISCEVGGDALPPLLSAHSPSQRSSATGSPRRSKPIDSKRLKSSSKGTRRSGLGSLQRRADVTATYITEQMADRLGATLISNEYSQELIDVRRSLHHRYLFSEMTRQWSVEDRQRLIETIYLPYRRRMRTKLARMLSRSQYVLHLSVQSFPLVSVQGSGKQVRRADMGLLYDPGIEDEVDLSLDWIDEMYDEIPMLRVRRNYPQRGTRDSITKAMRSEFAGKNYIGIELMVNQAWAGREIAIRDEVIDGICWTLQTVLEVPHTQAA